MRHVEDVRVARKRHAAEEIVAKLCQVDVPTAQGRGGPGDWGKRGDMA